MIRALLSTLVLAVSAIAAAEAGATCRMATAGAKCAEAPTRSSLLEPGAQLPEGARLLFNPSYYGLPPSDGSWRYYIVERVLYRADAETGAILERVQTVRQRW
jgi:hypothetical protein